MSYTECQKYVLIREIFSLCRESCAVIIAAKVLYNNTKNLCLLISYENELNVLS